ncbi:hypothetical protein [Variovorax sp. W2I14]|uniref:hypothetical protein n=1 Tax=Variovorax sp. W2I14 TaxID=3042290 RepID=UPI003D193B56
MIYENPSYSIIANLNVDTDVDYNFASNKLSAHFDAVSTDLTRFNYVEAVNARYGASHAP